jgi:hypothetical protein
MAKRSVNLSDGSTVTVSLHGDEYLNWFETDSGEVILYSKARKRFEHPQITDDDLRPSGVAYAPAKGPSHSAALQPSVTRSELVKIWRDKRAKATAQPHPNR